MLLTRQESDAVEHRVSEAEARTGVEIVATVVGRCDAYLEVPWIAFSLGAVFAGAFYVLADLLFPDWASVDASLGPVVTMLAAGSLLALLSVMSPAIARLFLRPERAAAEVRQYAQAHFLRRGILDTPGRTGVLLLVSLFERRVVILADKGLDKVIHRDDWSDIVDHMTSALRNGRTGDALLRGVVGTEQLLFSKGFNRDEGPNLMPDRPTEEAGEP